MIQIIAVQCPKCGANLDIEEDRKLCFCKYCGTKIMIDDESKTVTYRTVDEASIKAIELEEKIRMMEFEASQNNRHNRKPLIVILGVLAVILVALIGTLFILFGPRDNETSEEKHESIHDSADEKSNEILKTENSLKEYIDLLGVDTVDGNYDVSQQFLDNINNVYIMGYEGTVSHGFTDNTKVIRALDWVSNENVQEVDYIEYITRLNEFFGKEPVITHYENITDENCYVWDIADKPYWTMSWYDKGTMFIRWYTRDSNVRNESVYDSSSETENLVESEEITVDSFQSKGAKNKLSAFLDFRDTDFSTSIPENEEDKTIKGMMIGKISFFDRDSEISACDAEILYEKDTKVIHQITVYAPDSETLESARFMHLFSTVLVRLGITDFFRADEMVQIAYEEKEPIIVDSTYLFLNMKDNGFMVKY